MSDNPFAEPDDSERTVIRPSPGGRRPEPAAMPPLPEPAPEPFHPAPMAEGAETVAMGVNPLVAAAGPVLQLMTRLRNTATQPDPGELRERAVQGMRAFEQNARAAGVPIELLRPAHYALCASLDDVVLNTPWGSTGVWDVRSLVATFHQQVVGGDRFFDLLTQMRQNPGQFLPVVELLYLCVSLGFQGRYRLSPRGPAELDRLREETYALIVRQRTPVEPGLSPHWRGVAAPYRPSRMTVPLWVVASAAAAVLAAVFVWFSTSLNAASDDVYAQMLRVPPTHMPDISRVPTVAPVPLAPAPAPVVDRICTLLKPEVDRGTVTVKCLPPTPLIRILDRGMFASGSATVETPFMPLLERIGALLKDEPGAIEVVGYTDNQPIHTVQFPSNFQLSAARAAAAKGVFDRAIGDGSRITATGRGEDDPLNGNASADERAQNRRIEIVLHRPE
jgi:type VI secretion system protein ImpK